MAEYFLKVSFVIGLALIFYKLVLQQESFFVANRIFFIGSILVAFALPHLQLPQLVNHQGLIPHLLQIEEGSVFEDIYHDPSGSENHVLSANDEGKPVAGVEEKSKTYQNSEVKTDEAVSHISNSSFSWIHGALILYGFGVAVFALNLLFQVGSVFYAIVKNQDKIDGGNYVLVNAEKKQAPCSFFKYIFICPDIYDFKTYEQILAHEKIHVQQGHSWDLLFTELAVVVLWFNPLIWLLKKEVEKNLEFQADAILLEQEEVDKAQYQMNLLQIATPHKPLTITTNYNQSLLKQRIMMMNAKISTLNRYWKYAFVVPLILGTLLLLNEPAISQKAASVNAEPAPMPQPEPTPSPQVEAVPVAQPTFKDNADMTHGFYYSYLSENQYCIDFKGNDKEGRWAINACFDKSAVKKKSDDVFTITNEAGALKLIGQLDSASSQGKYEFIPNASFENYLSDINLAVPHKNYLFHLHLHGVDREYVDFVQERFHNVKGEQLLAMAIHRITKDYIADLAQVGFQNLSPDQVIAAKIHNINPPSIKELQALGFGNLGIDKLIALNVHQVNAAYIGALKKAGFKEITADEAIAAKIHDVDANVIKTIEQLGFPDLSLRKIIELQIHNVDAAFLQELKEAGYENLTLSEAIQAKIHDINLSFLQEMHSLGFNDIGFGKLLQAKIHEVNGDYLNDLKSMGFTDLTIDKAIKAKIHGIDSRFIKEAKNKGYNLQTLDEYIRIKIHGFARNGSVD